MYTPDKIDRDFCVECREAVEYELKREIVEREIRGKKYAFRMTTAYCKKCGTEMSVPGLIDLNIREMDEQYRAAENIIPISDIKKLMAIYNLDKTSLSLALGFEEDAISRYLAGQIPSKEHSDIMRKELVSENNIIEKASKIIDECVQIDAKNRTDREEFLKKQADFRKRLADTQSDIQTLRESIRQTMPNG